MHGLVDYGLGMNERNGNGQAFLWVRFHELRSTIRMAMDIWIRIALALKYLSFWSSLEMSLVFLVGFLLKIKIDMRV